MHDFEPGNRALVPVLNLAQDSINILGDGELAEGGIDDRCRAWRNLVGEIGPSRGLHGCVGFEGDFVGHNRELSTESEPGASGATRPASVGPAPIELSRSHKEHRCGFLWRTAIDDDNYGAHDLRASVTARRRP